MLVKFEEEEKKNNNGLSQPVINIDELSIEAGKKEAEIEKEKYTPTQEDLDRLEEELRRVNEQKFGSLIKEYQAEPIGDPEIKRLSYTRRDA
jgi:hypothetical protein